MESTVTNAAGITSKDAFGKWNTDDTNMIS